MIESEISILTAIEHPNIIQLEEVFDFPGEKYLVMEYVQVNAQIYSAFSSRFSEPHSSSVFNRAPMLTQSSAPLSSSQGGDLFDAIATDIKYSEEVARDMIHDLADALQVLL